MNNESFFDHETLITGERLGSEAVVGALEIKTSAIGDHRSVAALHSKAARIALVESRVFMGECIHRSLRAALSLPVEIFSSLSELEKHLTQSFSLFFLSLGDVNQEE